MINFVEQIFKLVHFLADFERKQAVTQEQNEYENITGTSMRLLRNKNETCKLNVMLTDFFRSHNSFESSWFGKI